MAAPENDATGASVATAMVVNEAGTNAERLEAMDVSVWEWAGGKQCDAAEAGRYGK